MSQPISSGQRSSGIPIWAWFVIIPCGCLLFVPVILAAILFPVFSQARESARTASCASNLKQLSLGALMYSQDYDDVFPDSKQWAEAISPYVKNNALLTCPSVQKGSEPAYGYAMNRATSRVKLSKVRTPATVPMLYDSTNLIRNATDSFTSLPNPGRHGKVNNVAYLDGHVKHKRTDISGSSDTSGTSDH